MGNSTNYAGIKQITAGLLQHVADADLDMQIYQAYTWKRAAAKIPFLQKLDKGEMGGKDSAEGIDRLNNLGVSGMDLSFSLVEVKPNWFKRQWRKLTNKNAPKQFRFGSSHDEKIQEIFKVFISVKRKPSGQLKAEKKVEKIPQEVMHAKLPNVFS